MSFRQPRSQGESLLLLPIKNPYYLTTLQKGNPLESQKSTLDIFNDTLENYPTTIGDLLIYSSHHQMAEYSSLPIFDFNFLLNNEFEINQHLLGILFLCESRR